jgi:hypothetical protein
MNLGLLSALQYLRKLVLVLVTRLREEEKGNDIVNDDDMKGR